MGGENPENVNTVMKGLQEKLTDLGLHIPESKCQRLAQEVKFLGPWWVRGAASVPPNTLRQLSSMEVQQILGTLRYWQKHIPGFSIIARPLYNLLKKGKAWEWTEQHANTLELLINDLRLFQQLEPVHPTDPIHVEYGFSEHGSHYNLWQTDQVAQRDHESFVPVLLFILKQDIQILRKDYCPWYKQYNR